MQITSRALSRVLFLLLAAIAVHVTSTGAWAMPASATAQDTGDIPCWTCNTRFLWVLPIHIHRFAIDVSQDEAILETEQLTVGSFIASDQEETPHFRPGAEQPTATNDTRGGYPFTDPEGGEPYTGNSEGDDEPAGAYVHCFETGESGLEEQGPAGCHHIWYMETCLQWHAPCSGGSEVHRAEDIAAAVNSRNAVEILTMVSNSSDKIKLHHARRSIQLMDCHGGVTANVPLDRALYRTLVRLTTP
jgi:hypothetical protein